MGFFNSEHNFMQFLCKVPCVFISWVAFLIQDTEEWKPCIVNTQCGRCYRQITRCYSQTYNMNPCQEPCTMQALYICYLIYPSQPTKAGTLGNILTLQMSNLRWRTSLSLPEDPESEEEGWGSHSVGLCRETPPPPPPTPSLLLHDGQGLSFSSWPNFLPLSTLYSIKKPKNSFKKNSWTSTAECLLHGKRHTDRNFASFYSNWSLPPSWYTDAEMYLLMMVWGGVVLAFQI